MKRMATVVADDDLVSRIAALEARLQLIEDDRAIRELLARYGFTADMGRGEAFVALYTDDGAIDVSPDHRFEGQAGVTEFITNASGYAGQTMHLMGNNLVTYIGQDAAVAEGYSIALIREEGGFRVLSCSVNRWTLKKQSGVWRIRERFLRAPGADGYGTVLSTEGYPEIVAVSE